MNMRGMNLKEWFDTQEISEKDKNTSLTVDDLIASRALRGEKILLKRRFVRITFRREGIFIGTSGNTLHDENKNIIGAFIIFRDITKMCTKNRIPRKRLKNPSCRMKNNLVDAHAVAVEGLQMRRKTVGLVRLLKYRDRSCFPAELSEQHCK